MKPSQQMNAYVALYAMCIKCQNGLGAQTAALNPKPTDSLGMLDNKKINEYVSIFEPVAKLKHGTKFRSQGCYFIHMPDDHRQQLTPASTLSSEPYWYLEFQQ